MACVVLYYINILIIGIVLSLLFLTEGAVIVSKIICGGPYIVIMPGNYALPYLNLSPLFENCLMVG